MDIRSFFKKPMNKDVSTEDLAEIPSDAELVPDSSEELQLIDDRADVIISEEVSNFFVVEIIFIQLNVFQAEYGPPAKKRRKASHDTLQPRKAKYNASYTEKFKDDYITPSSKGKGNFCCNACNSDIDFGKMGEFSITQHIGGKRHKENVKALNISLPMRSFISTKTVSLFCLFCSHYFALAKRRRIFDCARISYCASQCGT